jgi:hypothetical protein
MPEAGAKQALLNMFDYGVDIAKLQPFFCRQLQLPADTLLGKKLTSDVARHWVAVLSTGRYQNQDRTAVDRSTHAAVPAAGRVKKRCGHREDGREIFHHQEAVIAVADSQDFGYAYRITAGEQFKLVSFCGENGQ